MELHIEEFGHGHQFNLCNWREKGGDVQCNVCGEPLVGNRAYKCSGCDFWTHKSCAKLPREMVHPFHPQHPLHLSKPPSQDNSCGACGRKSDCARDRGHFLFHCSGCNFYLHIRCASLTVTPTSQKQLPDSGHPHSLFLCTKGNKLFNFVCSCCHHPIEDSSLYVCIDCKFLLHISCAFPREIAKHPFHPKHNLVLGDELNLEFRCDVCNTSQHVSRYKCDGCAFQADFRCIWPIPRIIEFKFHKHPLLVFYVKAGEDHGNFCMECHKVCNSLYFKCGECPKYNLHLRCSQKLLPLTIKHEGHTLHPLTITNPLAKAYSKDLDDDKEFHCKSCKKNIHRSDSSYSCTKCFYDVHIECASSAIIRTLLDEKEESGGHKPEDAALGMPSKVTNKSLAIEGSSSSSKSK